MPSCSAIPLDRSRAVPPFGDRRPPWIPALWKRRLVWAALSALLLAMVQCAADVSHRANPIPGGPGSASRSLSTPQGSLGGNTVAGRQAPDGCSASDAGRAGVTPLPFRALPCPATAAAHVHVAGPLVAEPLDALRSWIPNGGRTALAALCRWLI
ncbi:hypothetical protein ACWEJP_04615 [Streptomyces sp. NPDC004749]